MILTRYFHRQASRASLLTLTVLMGVVSALFLAELLSEVAGGGLGGASVAWLLLLRLPEALLMVAPLALLVGLLLALGQAHESSELVVARASGVGFQACFGPLLGLASIWALAVLLVSGWISPWALERHQGVMEQVAERAVLAGLSPGQFKRLDQGRITLYVASVESSTGELDDVFLQHSGADVTEVVSAPKGRLWHDPIDQTRYLSLTQGHQLRQLKTGGSMQMTFDQNDVRLPPPTDDAQSQAEMMATLTELWPVTTAVENREWHWRWAAPIGTFLLAALAIPLAWRSPRSGRFGAVIVAIVVYLVYSNGVHMGLVWMERSQLSSGLGLWPIHLILGISVAALWFWRWRQW